jgi:23S rRNA pseudouridine1911/1915/1917 synthase
MKKNLIVQPDNPPMRADVYISDIAGLMPRNQLKSRNADLTVNSRKAKLSTKVRPGDTIELEYEENVKQNITPEKTELDIIYEDDDVVVLNKKRGIVVHPANGHYSGTLAQGLAWYLGNKLDSENNYRTGIVHRLDKDTSGVLITAKTMEAHEFLSAQFKNKICSKMYLAIVRGHLKERKGTIENYLSRDRRDRKRYAVAPDGKLALTTYKLIRLLNKHSLVALYPHTGRTHQLRVHMKSIGHPIAGDPVYSRKSSPYPLLLHAYKLHIVLPSGAPEPAITSAPSVQATEKTMFRAPLPQDFKTALHSLSLHS